MSKNSQLLALVLNRKAIYFMFSSLKMAAQQHSCYYSCVPIHILILRHFYTKNTIKFMHYMDEYTVHT